MPTLPGGGLLTTQLPPGERADVERAAAERPSPRARLVRFGLVAALVVADLWTKSAVFRWLTVRPGGEDRERFAAFAADDRYQLVHASEGWWRFTLWEPWLYFMLGENKGAAWGLFADYPWLLLGARVAAVLLLLVLVWRLTRPWTLVWALVLILAGALGNLHDNLMRRDGSHPIGGVRDFIDVYFARWDWHFPTFNVADSCITVGAVLLIWSMLRPEPEPPQAVEPGGPGATR